MFLSRLAPQHDTHSRHLIADMATIHASGVTGIPVKARAKRKRVSQESDPEDIPWTAARCNRLLRTITSRLSILEKVGKANWRKLQTTTPAKQCLDRLVQSDDRVELLASSANNTTSTIAADPEWLPLGRERSYYKTYAGRPKLRNSTGAISERLAKKHQGGLSFATPFVKRMLQPQAVVDIDNEVQKRQSKDEVRSRQLPVKTSSCVQEAHRNLLTAVESMLQCTKNPRPKMKAGSASLRNIALRKIPKLIELEESQLDVDDNFEVASDLYAELENLGSNVDTGWSGLREVVRAHAIRKLELAIARRLLPEHIVQALVDTCGRCAAVREGQRLLLASAFCSRDIDGGIVVKNVLAFSLRNDCREFLFQTLSRLLQECGQSLRTVSANAALWREVLAAMMDPKSRWAATEFLEISVLRAEIEKASCTDPETTDHTTMTLMNVTALLTAMAVSTGQPESAERSIGASLQRIATSTFLHAGHVDLGLPISLSNLVLLALDITPASNIRTLDDESITTDILLASTSRYTSSSTKPAAFVNEIARCLDCLKAGTGEEVLQGIVRGFLCMAAVGSSGVARLLRKVALDTALANSENNNGKICEAFVEEVVETLHSSGGETSTHTPRPKTSLIKGSYRWEAAIEEWIAQTPFVALEKKAKVAAHDVNQAPLDRPSRLEGLLMSPTVDELAMSPYGPPNATRNAEASSLRPCMEMQDAVPIRLLRRSLSDGNRERGKFPPQRKRIRLATEISETAVAPATRTSPTPPKPASTSIREPVPAKPSQSEKKHLKLVSHEAKHMPAKTTPSRRPEEPFTKDHRPPLRSITNSAVNVCSKPLRTSLNHENKIEGVDGELDELSMPTTKRERKVTFLRQTAGNGARCSHGAWIKSMSSLNTSNKGDISEDELGF